LIDGVFTPRKDLVNHAQITPRKDT